MKILYPLKPVARLAQLTRVNRLVIHCSATQNKSDIGAVEIDHWHREKGAFGIGYHYIIRRNGECEKGREDHFVGAHAPPANRDSLGICLVGGVEKIDGKLLSCDNFTEAQKDTLEALLRMLKAKYPEVIILGHRDLPKVAKDCPSFDVAAFVKQRNI